MRKRMLLIAIVVVLLVVLVAFLLWRTMSAPLYTPGMVRSGKNLRSSLDPPQQTGENNYWLVENDIRLFYTTQGEGRPILILHGGPGYPVHRPLEGLELLAKDYKVICYDQRGCGKSTRPFDRFSAKNFYSNMTTLEQTLGIGAQLADVERIRRILGEEKLILMGHSFGAFLAALYAAEFPHHVEAMVLVAPAGVLVLPGKGKGFFEQIRERLPGHMQAEYDSFISEYLNFGSVFSRSEKELATMNRRIGDFYLAAAGIESPTDETRVPEDNGGWMVQAMYFSMGKRHDYRPALQQVNARSLVIHGESDLLPESVSQMYADCLPNSRLHVLKNGRTRGGHFPFSEQPEAFATVVKDSLDGRQ